MYEKTAAIIETRFKNAWTDTPIKFENVQFKQPATGTWVSITILRGDGEQASLGQTKLERQYGVVAFQVFVPENTGTRNAQRLMDKIALIFRNKTVLSDGVTVIFRAPNAVTPGRRIGYHQLNMGFPFQAEKLFS